MSLETIDGLVEGSTGTGGDKKMTGYNLETEMKHRNYLMVFVGGPGNGKTTSRELLQRERFIGKEACVVSSDGIREKYEETSFSTSRWVSREERQLVYGEAFRRTELSLMLGRDTVIDATFDQASNRRRIYELAKSYGIQEVYVLLFYCEPDEAKIRIWKRSIELRELEEKGIRIDERLTMRSPEKYDRFNAEYELPDFDKEFIGDDEVQAHIIKVDTTPLKNTITLLNADAFSRDMARSLAENYNRMFRPERPYSVIEETT